MRILDRAVYVGPSLYAHFPVIRLEVDLGPLEEWPSARLGAESTRGTPNGGSCNRSITVFGMLACECHSGSMACGTWLMGSCRH